VRNIIAGPWFGEFGWELMKWSGIFRAIRVKNPNIKIVMVGRKANATLYSDYADEFLELEANGETDGWRINGAEPKLTREALLEYKDYIYMSPITCMRFTEQLFIRYGNVIPGLEKTILVHARSTTKCDSGNRNWAPEKWIRLVDKLHDRKYTVLSIGSSPSSMYIPGTDNALDLTLPSLMDTIRSSRIVIGPSSGPMHLASLCGTTHCVWTDDKYQPSVDGTNRQRYETKWNPLKTKAIVIDNEGWDPEVETVYSNILQELKGG
jgi:hypothetical protein